VWALSHSLVSADLIYTASSHKEVHLPAARSLPPYSCLPTQATPTISRSSFFLSTLPPGLTLTMSLILIVLQQVPVRLAYALTIHKCQGMTLSRAELSLGSAFEYGEKKLFLSPCTSLPCPHDTEYCPRQKLHRASLCRLVARAVTGRVAGHRLRSKGSQGASQGPQVLPGIAAARSRGAARQRAAPKSSG
jgi:hypothetical protein